LYFIHNCFFFVLIVLNFAFFVFYFYTNIHDPGGIRTRKPSKRSARGPRLKPLCHWDWQGIWLLGITCDGNPLRVFAIIQLGFMKVTELVMQKSIEKGSHIAVVVKTYCML
jgi:hypothetical protein